MAFDFLGRIESESIFNEFEEFINYELGFVTKRIRHLTMELDKLYDLLHKFKTADIILRGSIVSSDEPDTNWLVKPKTDYGTEVFGPDSSTGIEVARLKNFVLDTIKYKRERNEFNVKRIRDLIEQINNEILYLEGNANSLQNI